MGQNQDLTDGSIHGAGVSGVPQGLHATRQLRLSALAENFQTESLFGNIYPVEDSPYRDADGLLKLSESGPIGGDLRRHHFRDFLEHDALILGWDKGAGSSALVIALKACAGPEQDFRTVWGGDKPLGTVLAKLQAIPEIGSSDGSIDPSRVHMVLLDWNVFENLRDLIDNPAKRTQALAMTPAAETGMQPVPELFMRIIARAAREGASDVHLFPIEKGYAVQYRTDGEIIAQRDPLPLSVGLSMISHIKHTAGLRPDERRFPQSGKYVFDDRDDFRTHHINGLAVRIECMPCDSAFAGYQTEAVGLRLQTELGSDRFDLRKLGYSPAQLQAICGVLDAPDGLILLAGPTGSGKTTTLYSCLQYLNDGRNRVYTVEDPIEARFERVTQTQILPAKDFTFAAALRSLLRMDPDVIMIGEVRDEETAQTAIKAVTTGHQVLSTLHTPNAVAIATRLQELNIAPSQLASAFSMGIAQRLVRLFDKTQPGAIQEYDGKDELNALCDRPLFTEPVALYRARPGMSGMLYKGRTCVSEIWIPGDKTRSALAERKLDFSELRKMAITEDGLEPLLFHGMRLVLSGETSLTELRRSVVAASEFREMPDVVANAVKTFGRPLQAK